MLYTTRRRTHLKTDLAGFGKTRKYYMILKHITTTTTIPIMHRAQTEHCRACGPAIPGLFVPRHFRSRERKDHRENFRSRGTFVPWNIRSLELSFLWNFRSSGAKVPRTFVPTKLSYHENEYFKNFRSKCPKTRPINLTIAYAH